MLKPSRSEFDWQGHRGCRGLRPENSVPAFLHALDFPEVKTLELDLAVSRDGELIVSHEPWFNPVICQQPGGTPIPAEQGESLLLYQLTAAEIRHYNCGSLPHPRFPQQVNMEVYKPTLREVVEAVRAQAGKRVLRWNLEIKSEPGWDGVRTPPIETFAELVLKALNELNIKELSTVQSFDVRPLQIMRRLDPSVQLALLVENEDSFEANLQRLGFTPPIYSPYFAFVDETLLRQCRERKMQLVPWTVNDVPTMQRLVELGVDGIITDYPNLISEVKMKK